VWRYDSVVVPAGADPALGLRAGERLLVDRHPRAVHPGDYVFHADAGGTRRLVRIEAVRTDARAPHSARGAGGAATEVSHESIVARVILIWPF
jgi:hypothetical protein